MISIRNTPFWGNYYAIPRRPRAHDKLLENNIPLEKVTERIRRVRRHWLLSLKIMNFKTWEPGNFRTVFKTGKLTLRHSELQCIAIHVKFKSYQQLSLRSVLRCLVTRARQEAEWTSSRPLLWLVLLQTLTFILLIFISFLFYTSLIPYSAAHTVLGLSFCTMPLPGSHLYHVISCVPRSSRVYFVPLYCSPAPCGFYSAK